MSFLTGQDRTPNLPDRSFRTGLNPDLYFQTFYLTSTGYKILNLDGPLKISKISKIKITLMRATKKNNQYVNHMQDTKGRVSLNSSILELHLFTLVLFHKNMWRYLSAVLSKVTIRNKSSSKNKNKDKSIQHFSEILGFISFYQLKAIQYE